MTTATADFPAAFDETPGVRLTEAVAFSFLIALSAQWRIHLPFTPVPITAQTLAVLASGTMLGPAFGMLACLLYLAEGVLGLPFFAGGAAGAGSLLGPTGGYLIGFVGAAGLTGAMAARGWDKTPLKAAAAALAGSAVVLACGLAGLRAWVPADRLLAAGLWPFVPGDLLKTLLAAGLFPAWRRMAGGADRRF